MALIKITLLIATDHQAGLAITSWQSLAFSLSAALVPLLLIIIGWSAAETAYYFNQNSRSLMHRYNTQQGRISKWFKALSTVVPFTELSARPLDSKPSSEIRDLVLQFEDLMVDELIDWLHISRHDVIEIAP
jgi:hypothetical protein